MEFTGERFLPSLDFPDISYEHWHRYLYATQLVKDKVILDIACGEGYGSHLLAQYAKHVVGIDIDSDTINHASHTYIRKNLEFKIGSLENIPLTDEESIDGVVSFESIEHINEEQQEAFLGEVKRILKPGGFLLISTPNKSAYSDAPGYKNEFHVKEFYVQEFRAFLEKQFKYVRFLGQRIYPVSYLWDTEEEASRFVEFRIELSPAGFRSSSDEKDPLYIVALCSNNELTNIYQSVQLDLSGQMFVVRDQQIQMLRSQAEELSKLLNDANRQTAIFSTQLIEANQQLASVSAQLIESNQQVTSVKAKLNKHEETIRALNSKLLEIYGSRGWKLVQLLWNVRRSVAPPASRREQILQRTIHLLLTPWRKFRGMPQDTQASTRTDFDKDWYLASYPDVARANLDPYQHYMQRGRFEGRLGSPPKLDLQQGRAGFDPTKKTVLVVSHEATRTGAPVLSFNLVQNLKEKYNVVSLLLGPGPIVKNFLDISSSVVGPVQVRTHPVLADGVVAELVRLYDFKFAVVNSIEARVVLRALAKRFIPAVILIHEFATYTKPEWAFTDAALWSQEMVFSASVTRENAVLEHPELAEHSFSIIPQGQCAIPLDEEEPNTRAREGEKVLKGLRPDGLPPDTIVVLGAGTVQMRKGVDLFIDCAARLLRSGRNLKFRFVWIGSGFNPEKDLAYSVYLADQIQRAGLQEHVLFMENTSNIEAAYQAADILLISSRLDPLPNVAIDAMVYGMPVLCFDKTTGVADILASYGLADQCVSPYLDTEDMADKILTLIESSSMREDLGARLRQLALKEFDIGRYTNQIEELALASGLRIAREQLDASEIGKSGIARLDYYQNRHLKDLLSSPEEVFRYYVRTWASGIRRRKLFPGFHPGIFLEQSGICTDESDPLAAYLRAGKPEGPWSYEVLASDDVKPSVPSNERIALHLHVYYSDLLPDMLARLNKNRARPDLFISLPVGQNDKEVQVALKGYSGKVIELQQVPNRGRDIGPFLTEFGNAFIDQYDIVGHLHTKKTACLQDGQMGEDWRLFLLENLLGSKTRMADLILGCMTADASIGLVFPDDPHIVGWNKNRPFAEDFGKHLGLSVFPDNFLFPIGTMFWARVDALKPLFEARLDWHDYPDEPLPDDGSILHAMERLLPFVVSKQGFRMALTNVPGVTR